MIIRPEDATSEDPRTPDRTCWKPHQDESSSGTRSTPRFKPKHLGRPPTGKTRGTWAGTKRNQRLQGEPVLRRDPSASEKLSMLNMLKSKVNLPESDDLVRQASTATRNWFEVSTTIINKYTILYYTIIYYTILYYSILYYTITNTSTITIIIIIIMISII